MIIPPQKNMIMIEKQPRTWPFAPLGFSAIPVVQINCYSSVYIFVFVEYLIDHHPGIASSTKASKSSSYVSADNPDTALKGEREVKHPQC